MKFIASLPTFSCILMKGIIVTFGGTEEVLEVQGEVPVIRTQNYVGPHLGLAQQWNELMSLKPASWKHLGITIGTHHIAIQDFSLLEICSFHIIIFNMSHSHGIIWNSFHLYIFIRFFRDIQKKKKFPFIWREKK